MIDYGIIQESIKYYESNKFIRIESPWTVSKYVDDITRPKDRIPFQLKHNNKCLVASGEQSFLYLYLKDFLSLGQYQSVTPCYRFEEFDFTHTKYFLKNELIKTDFVNQMELENVVDVSLNFFKKYLVGCEVVDVENGFDIEWKGYELGSYGIRECDFLRWIYGTGCAEPRLSKIILLSNRLS